MNDLYRLVYSSIRQPSCNELDLQKILNISKQNNYIHGISGVLIHSNSRFLQYLEGCKLNLDHLFHKIQSDSRHTSVQVRDFVQIDERAFTGWEMGFKDLSINDIDYYTQTNGQIKNFDRWIKGDLAFRNSDLKLLETFFSF